MVRLAGVGAVAIPMVEAVGIPMVEAMTLSFLASTVFWRVLAPIPYLDLLGYAVRGLQNQEQPSVAEVPLLQ
jgi:hypothetical protein